MFRDGTVIFLFFFFAHLMVLYESKNQSNESGLRIYVSVNKAFNGSDKWFTTHSAQNHYLDQCWLIVNLNLGN